MIKDQHILGYDNEWYALKPSGRQVPLFNGDKKEYESWKTKCIGKYKEDFGYFLSKGQQYAVVYFFDCLTGTASALVEARHPNRAGPDTDMSKIPANFDEMMTLLDDLFMDRNRTHRAAEDYEEIKMGFKNGRPIAETFDEFLARYEAILMKLPADFVGTTKKVKDFREKLTRKLRDMVLAQFNQPQTFEEWVTVARQLYQNMEIRDQVDGKVSATRYTGYGTNSNAYRAPRAGGYSRSGTATPRYPTVQPVRPVDHAAVDLAAIAQFAQLTRTNKGMSISTDGHIPPNLKPSEVPANRNRWPVRYQTLPLLNYRYPDNETHKQKLYTLGICYMCQDMEHPHTSYDATCPLLRYAPRQDAQRRRRPLQNAVVDLTSEEYEGEEDDGYYDQESPNHNEVDVAAVDAEFLPEEEDSADEYAQENYRA